MRSMAGRAALHAHDCVDGAREHVIEVLAQIHLGHRGRLLIWERLGGVEEFPDDTLVRFSLLVAVQRLLVRAVR
jgi:hypothetical protein